MEDKQDKQKQMEELAGRLNACAYAYYTKDDPLISDKEYDALYQRLLELEAETGTVLPQSPTQRVGDRLLPGFPKHTHLGPLWSLDKSKTREELEDWQRRNQKLLADAGLDTALEYVVTMKFDGLTVNLTYDQGRLIHAATRGTGAVGEEVLPQIMTIRDLPPTIDSPALAEVRGEVIMTREAFEEYNKNAKTPLKNLRNGAAGALRNLDLAETKRRHLSAWFYDIGYWKGEPFPTYWSELEYLAGMGFTVHPFRRLCGDLDQVMEAVNEIESLRDGLNFDIDGAVVAVNDLSLRETLGVTAKAPRWSIAYKFEALEETTTLLAVEWNVGRTGKVTPTAILEPIELGGVTVSRATLNNMDDIRRKGVYIGARVFVRRSNDVIPEILGVAGEGEPAGLEEARRGAPGDTADGLARDTADGLAGDTAAAAERVPEGREIRLPRTCPVCGSELEQDGVHTFCPNAIGCKPQMVKAMAHFASREAMNIEGFSEKTAQQLFDALNLYRVNQLYTLKKEDLLGLEKFKDKKADNLLAAIEKSKDCKLESFLFGLGIPGVGKKTAEDLAEAFGSLEAVMAAEQEALLEVPEIGGIIAAGVYHFFRDPKIKEEIASLLELGVRPKAPDATLALAKEEGANPFAGKKVVVTGTLEHFGRREIQEKLRELGASAQDSVSKATDFLIYGEKAGSKLDKARKLNEAGEGPRILTEAEFLTMLQGGF